MAVFRMAHRYGKGWKGKLLEGNAGPGWGGESPSRGAQETPAHGLPLRSGPEGEPQGGPEIGLLGNSDSSGSGSCLCNNNGPRKAAFPLHAAPPRLSVPAARGPSTTRARGGRPASKPGECPGPPGSVVGEPASAASGRSLIVQAPVSVVCGRSPQPGQNKHWTRSPGLPPPAVQTGKLRQEGRVPGWSLVAPLLCRRRLPLERTTRVPLASWE